MACLDGLVLVMVFPQNRPLKIVLVKDDAVNKYTP